MLRHVAAGGCVLMLVGGVAYERYGRWQDRRRLPQIGRSVDIGGRTLNLYCSGTGSPPVILESPGAGPGLVWEPIQKEIAKFTAACWYDRAGEGWSDSGPYPRTSAAIAKDLHELLRRAGIPPPYVLVGASFGGLNVQVYGGVYPKEVAGMVLVDSADGEEPERAPKFYLARTAPRYLWRPLHIAFQVAAGSGWLRLMQPVVRKDQSRGEMSHSELIRALRQQPKSFVNNSTGIVMPESYAEAAAVNVVGDFPLIVLTAGRAGTFRDPEKARQAAAFQQVWIHEIQAKLVQLSTRGRQVVVADSDHGIQDRQPRAVIGAVSDVVAEARREASGRRQGGPSRAVVR